MNFDDILQDMLQKSRPRDGVNRYGKRLERHVYQIYG